MTDRASRKIGGDLTRCERPKGGGEGEIEGWVQAVSLLDGFSHPVCPKIFPAFAPSEFAS
jgi:hypothetical protein